LTFFYKRFFGFFTDPQPIYSFFEDNSVVEFFKLSFKVDLDFFYGTKSAPFVHNSKLFPCSYDSEYFNKLVSFFKEFLIDFEAKQISNNLAFLTFLESRFYLLKSFDNNNKDFFEHFYKQTFYDFFLSLQPDQIAMREKHAFFDMPFYENFVYDLLMLGLSRFDFFKTVFFKKTFEIAKPLSLSTFFGNEFQKFLLDKVAVKESSFLSEVKRQLEAHLLEEKKYLIQKNKILKMKNFSDFFIFDLEAKLNNVKRTAASKDKLQYDLFVLNFESLVFQFKDKNHIFSNKGLQNFLINSGTFKEYAQFFY